MRVLIGAAFGCQSPVATFAPTLLLDVQLEPGSALDLPALADEMALYTVSDGLWLDAEALPAQTLALLEPGRSTSVRAGKAGARCVVIGGAALDGPRHIWWNFVSSRKERIVQAADDWERDAMGRIPGESERIPLPPRRFLG